MGANYGLPEAVARLSGAGERDFLQPNHREAASRLSALFERANLRQRVTMSYDATHIPRGKGGGKTDVTDSAADARRRLAGLARSLPDDCWGVLVDTCVYDKGLQLIELERRWPRRAAKVVLRIALHQVAQQLGLNEMAKGSVSTAVQCWRPERVPMS